MAASFARTDSNFCAICVRVFDSNRCFFSTLLTKFGRTHIYTFMMTQFPTINTRHDNEQKWYVPEVCVCVCVGAVGCDSKWECVRAHDIWMHRVRICMRMLWCIHLMVAAKAGCPAKTQFHRCAHVYPSNFVNIAAANNKSFLSYLHVCVATTNFRLAQRSVCPHSTTHRLLTPCLGNHLRLFAVASLVNSAHSSRFAHLFFPVPLHKAEAFAFLLCAWWTFIYIMLEILFEFSLCSVSFRLFSIHICRRAEKRAKYFRQRTHSRHAHAMCNQQPPTNKSISAKRQRTQIHCNYYVSNLGSALSSGWRMLLLHELYALRRRGLRHCQRWRQSGEWLMLWFQLYSVFGRLHLIFSPASCSRHTHTNIHHGCVCAQTA